jgi:3-deoxy-manno-octulosonate cytidylyltransferase (CMP-KDO synthetase)
MKCTAIIPARLASTRLHEKPLADICGKTLIQRVYENALKLKNADDVVVATDSQKISEAVESFGGKCIITPENINSGSDRVYYTAKEHFPDAEILVNLQGDEPFMDMDFVGTLIEEAKDSKVGLYSAYYPVSAQDAEDSSMVKVTVDSENNAIYFSRSMIPFGAREYKKHLGLYVWKKDLLEKFYNTKPGYLETSEKLEQLRVLENGDKIKMLQSPADSIGIDTPEDLEQAIRLINEN